MDGVHIANRDDGDHGILLYQINGIESFYVDAYYHKEDNVLKKFKAFKSTELLDLYADQVDIVKLLNG